MNALARTFADFTRALEQLTAVPLTQDFFDWCREENRVRDMASKLSCLRIEYRRSEPFSDLKARLANRWKIEQRRNPAHWSYDWNRRVAMQEIMDAAEAFSARRTGAFG